MEEMPRTVGFDEPEADEEVTVFLDVPKPTREQLLDLYKAYREADGEPYEPFESMLKAREADATAAA